MLHFAESPWLVPTHLRASAGQKVRSEPQRPQLAHAVLRGLGLLLADHSKDGNQADVDQTEVVFACILNEQASVSGPQRKEEKALLVPVLYQ